MNAQQQFWVHGYKSANGLTAKAQKMVRGRTHGKHLKHPAIGNDSTDACCEQKVERCWLIHHPGPLLPRVRDLIIRFAVSSAQQKPTDSTYHRIVCGNGLAHGNCCSKNGLLLVLFWFWHACIFIIERAREGFSYQQSRIFAHVCIGNRILPGLQPFIFTCEQTIGKSTEETIGLGRDLKE